ncbi:Hpt domain-containing protein [Arthrobacter sp. D3-16]
MIQRPIPGTTTTDEEGRAVNGTQQIDRSGKEGPCLLNPAALEKLRSELDDDAGWLVFVSAFLAHLPRRMGKLHNGLMNADYDLAMDAVLSLKISCQMVGAERLAEMALRLQHTVIVSGKRDDVTAVSPQLTKLLDDLAACAEQTAHALGTRMHTASYEAPGVS